MTLRFTYRPLVAALFLAVTLIVFTGCDTSDPVPTVEPVEVAGVYDFTQFRFDPDRSVLLPVNVLDSLVADETSLRLADNGEFLLTYQFEGETFPDNVRGTFDASRDAVTLEARESDADRFAALLLPRQITFDREGDTVLLLDEQRTVDLAAYDEDYEGFDPQPGQLTVRLQLREPTRD
jgi:hypothetical protein